MKNCLFLLLFALTGCSLSRRLPPGEKLFAGSEIRLEADASISGKTQKALKSSLSELARPKRNARLLGFPFRVWLYYLIGEPKTETGLRASLRRKLGQAPVLASAKALSANAAVFSSFLENEGYFRSTASGQLVEKGYEARAVYQVRVQPRYTIDTVEFLTDSTPLRRALTAVAARTRLRQGDPYRFENLKTEQARIGQALKQRGYYYFLPEYVALLADSGLGQHRVKLYVAIIPEIPAAAGVPYTIRSVSLYPAYTLGNAARDTSRRRATRPMPGVQVVDSARLYDPRLFDEVLALRPGRRYNSRQQDLTLSRFINLGVFKFVRNRFAPSLEGDSAVLDVHYYLTPYPKKSVRLELAGVSRSNNLTGSQLTLSWRNRNALRRAELLTVNGNAGIEWQIGTRSQGVTNYRYGLDVSLALPRIISPFRVRADQRQALPKTTISAGYALIVRQDLYNLNSFNASYGYAWKTGQQLEQSILPLSATFVRSSNFGNRFFDLLSDTSAQAQPLQQQYLSLLQSNQFILSSVYSLGLNSSPRTASAYTYRLSFNAEPAGNLAGLLVKTDDASGLKKVAGQAFSQYLRFDLDSRHYLKLAPSLTWASRFFAGVGIPYGNAPYSERPQLPFVKQFFVGGSTGLRAFRPRAIGPGIYRRDVQAGLPLLQDGGGDVKFEASTELRPVFNKYLQGALFVDAGNVWMFSDESTYGPGSRFSPTWWRELAVGGGLGLRVDLSYFVLRFDAAFPFRKPYLPDGQRWVLDQINFRDRDWRRDNLILNVAVGYPF